MWKDHLTNIAHQLSCCNCHGSPVGVHRDRLQETSDTAIQHQSYRMIIMEFKKDVVLLYRRLEISDTAIQQQLYSMIIIEFKKDVVSLYRCIADWKSAIQRYTVFIKLYYNYTI